MYYTDLNIDDDDVCLIIAIVSVDMTDLNYKRFDDCCVTFRGQLGWIRGDLLIEVK